MRYCITILSLLFISCAFFEEESSEMGICVFDELIFIEDEFLYTDYDCFDNIVETACNSNWYPNQSCEEFCEEKLNEEGTFCD